MGCFLVSPPPQPEGMGLKCGMPLKRHVLPAQESGNAHAVIGNNGAGELR